MSTTLQERNEALQARANRTDAFVDITGTLGFWIAILSLTFPIAFCLIYFSDQLRRIQNSFLLAVVVSSAFLLILSVTKLLINEVASHDYRKFRDNPLGYITMQSMFRTNGPEKGKYVSALFLVISVGTLTAIRVLVPELEYQPLLELFSALGPD